MSNFGKTLFSGSRLIFRSLAPFLLLFAIVMPLVVDHWTLRSIVVMFAMEVCTLLLVLGLFDPQRFDWAFRGVTAIVFLAYLAYFIDEFCFSDQSFSWSGRRSDTSPRNAFFGFIFIGAPSLWYTLTGRWTLRKEEDIVQGDFGDKDTDERS